jgi:hypothetical protein
MRPVHQARDAVLGEVDHAKELTSSARHAATKAAQQAWQAAAAFAAPVVDIFQRADGAEGTELRKQLGVARESLNAQLYAAQMQLQESRKVAGGQLEPVKGAVAVAQQRTCKVSEVVVPCSTIWLTSSCLDAAELVKANEFRREHPEIAAAGLAVVVGVPSLLIREWMGWRNHVEVERTDWGWCRRQVAVGAGAAACYGSDKWAEKKRK